MRQQGQCSGARVPQVDEEQVDEALVHGEPGLDGGSGDHGAGLLLGERADDGLPVLERGGEEGFAEGVRVEVRAQSARDP